MCNLLWHYAESFGESIGMSRGYVFALRLLTWNHQIDSSAVMSSSKFVSIKIFHFFFKFDEKELTIEDNKSSIFGFDLCNNFCVIRILLEECCLAIVIFLPVGVEVNETSVFLLTMVTDISMDSCEVSISDEIDGNVIRKEFSIAGHVMCSLWR